VIYMLNSSKVNLGFVGLQWEQRIVAELESSMKKWIESVPSHLRWDPDRQNEMHLQQSALLYAQYHYLRILIHRPFIRSPENHSNAQPHPTAETSLTICNHAAQSCSHVLDALGRITSSKTVMPVTLLAAFTSALVLLIPVRVAKTAAIRHIRLLPFQKCVEYLKLAQADWPRIEQLVHILETRAGEPFLAPSPHSPATGPKRGRSFETSSSPDAPFTAPNSEANVRPIAKLKETASSSAGNPSSYPLPTPLSIHGLPRAWMDTSSFPAASDGESSAYFGLAAGSAAPIPDYEHHPSLVSSFREPLLQNHPILTGDPSQFQYDENSAMYTAAYPYASTSTVGQQQPAYPSFLPMDTAAIGDNGQALTWNNPSSYFLAGAPDSYAAAGARDVMDAGGDSEQPQPLPNSQQDMISEVDGEALMGSDEFGIWQAAPDGFGLEAWSNYISNMNGTTISFSGN